MAKPFIGGIRTSTSHVRQKNGDIYVYSRKTEYIQVEIEGKKVGKTIDLGRTLIGKIPAGSKEMVPTRPKKKSAPKPSEAPVNQPEIDGDLDITDPGKARTKRVGLTLLLTWAGKESGITEDLGKCFDKGDAQKIETAAQFWNANQGQRLTNIEDWQKTHTTPYKEGMTRRVYHSLFRSIGTDSSSVYDYFKKRAARTGPFEALALDSTTISTDAKFINSARTGYNKAGDGKDTVKLTTIYALNTKQPIAFIKQPGNSPDMTSVERTVKELEWLDMTSVQVVTDRGYCSQNNILKWLRNHVKFLTGVKVSSSWVSKEFEAHFEELEHPENSRQEAPHIHGITVPLQKTFQWEVKGEKRTQAFRLYLHLFKNVDQAVEEEKELTACLLKLKKEIEEEKTEFDGPDQARIEQYITISRKGRGGKPKASIDLEAVKAEKKWFGCFALVSNKAEGCYTALENYRLREKIEETFKDTKNRFDGHKTRVWTDDTLQGRWFTQFVGLGYYCFIKSRIDALKADLTAMEKKGAEESGLSEKEWNARVGLLKWLKGRSMQGIMNWADAIEKTTIKLGNGRSLTALSNYTERDALFFKLLGIEGLVEEKKGVMLKKEPKI